MATGTFVASLGVMSGVAFAGAEVIQPGSPLSPPYESQRPNSAVIEQKYKKALE